MFWETTPHTPAPHIQFGWPAAILIWVIWCWSKPDITILTLKMNSGTRKTHKKTPINVFWKTTSYTHIPHIQFSWPAAILIWVIWYWSKPDITILTLKMNSGTRKTHKKTPIKMFWKTTWYTPMASLAGRQPSWKWVFALHYKFGIIHKLFLGV